jgi:streptogramin lyase
VSEFILAVPYRETPDGIALGPDGSMWYTEHGNGGGAMVGKITRTGVATQYSQGITPKSYPIDIARGPGPTLWFTQDADLIGRITL